MFEDDEAFDNAEDAIAVWEDENGVQLDQEQFDYLVDELEAAADANGGQASVAEVVARWQQEPSEEELHHAAEVEFINERMQEWQARTGRRLSADEIQQLGDLAMGYRDEYGPPITRLLDDFEGQLVSEEQAEAAAVEQEAGESWDVSFENGVQRLEQKLERKLLERERRELADLLPDETDGELDVVGVWEDGPGKDGDPYGGSNGRVKWMTARIEERREAENPTPETVERPGDDASDEQWQQYMVARLKGAEVAEPEEAEPAQEAASG